MARHLNYFMIRGISQTKYSPDYQAVFNISIKAISFIVFFLVCDIAYPVVAIGEHHSVPVIKKSATKHIAQLEIPLLTPIFGVSEDLTMTGKHGPEVIFHRDEKVIGHYVRKLTGNDTITYTYVPNAKN
jgi:hypothetical protein